MTSGGHYSDQEWWQRVSAFRDERIVIGREWKRWTAITRREMVAKLIVLETKLHLSSEEGNREKDPGRDRERA